MKGAAELSPEHKHYQTVAKAIYYLIDNKARQPSLAELSKELGVSEYHLQRVFTQWAGLSPKQFLQYLTKEQAKQQLQSQSVMESSWACGLSGSSRLHDLLITHESITPGEYKKQGSGMYLYYGVHSSPYGYCFIAVTDRGVCKLAFFDNLDDTNQFIAELKNEWSLASIAEDCDKTSRYFCQLFPERDIALTPASIHLVLKATPFRLLVWEALLKIPEGSMLSYQQVANLINKPKAVRAVASAIASNQIGYLIPCHRVIRESGVIGEYRWGGERKMAILGREHSLCHNFF